jgi:hypothetical protein
VCSALLNSLAAEPIKIDKPKQPWTKQDCIAKGGKWDWYPVGKFFFCAIKTRDAGKACSDDSECQGDCIPTKHASKLPGISQYQVYLELARHI